VEGTSTDVRIKRRSRKEEISSKEKGEVMNDE